MPTFEVRPISAADTRPLRQAILRPHQSIHELAFHGDDAPDTLHVGAFCNEQHVGVASVLRDPPPGEVGATFWRLRAMAVLPDLQRRGCGAALLEACLAHARKHDGKTLWCNARSSAAGFYRKFGFEICSEEFELPRIGPHFVMQRPI